MNTPASPNAEISHEAPITLARLQGCKDILKQEYLRHHDYPWVIAYSGGKDSTVLLQLVWETIAALPSDSRKRPVLVIGNDTLVESPLVIAHLRSTVEKIAAAASKAEFPLTTRITRPHVDQTFWVNVIGRGYIPPTRNFRWCTDRMKILPTSQLLEDLVARHRAAVLLIGTRKAESENRRRSMTKHDVAGARMTRHTSIPDCRMFAPLADFTDNDIWTILLQRPPPWGGSHHKLITLYRNAGGGECPLVLTADDAPSCGTTSPRFGCWTCTVIKKDRSLRGVIDSGHTDAAALGKLYDFRDWLIDLREDNTNRLPVRRTGATRVRADGSLVFGPFTLDVRKRILQALEDLEVETGWPLLSQAERDVIEDIWRRDRIVEASRAAFNEAVVAVV
ncbi:MAG: DNA phosphorothioation system sulfurtransferase DndC [Rhodobacteraceae bacterium]|nr:DNA phosphorothioation system sulfurtransferase DndC [Paracoccaceae bacterium]